MSKLASRVCDHEETGTNELSLSTTASVNVHNLDNRGGDISVNGNNYFLPGCIDGKDYKNEENKKKISVDSACSINMFSGDSQVESPTAATDNIHDDVMVVRTSAMGAYPMSLLTSSSPMNKSISSSASGSICRICLEGDCVEELISPCDCIGSMSVVHICCLEKWLSTSNLDRCEVCKYQFNVRRTPRPVIQWLFSRQSRDGPHGFCGDALCLVLLTPICLTSVYLCGMGSLAYLQRKAWEGIGLAFLSLIVLFTFFLWGFSTIRFQWQSLNRWRLSNQTVHLVDHNKTRRRRQLGPSSQCNAHRSPASPPYLPSHI